MEEGGERWSKPHVATLSLHSLFELRSFLLNGTVILDMDASTLEQIVDLLLDNMINQGQLTFESREKVRIIFIVYFFNNYNDPYICFRMYYGSKKKIFPKCLMSTVVGHVKKNVGYLQNYTLLHELYQQLMGNYSQKV